MLTEIIHKLAAQFQDENNRGYSPRPSLAGPDRCVRQIVYMANGMQGNKRGDRMFFTLDDSSWHEELTLDWLRKSAFQVHSEQMEIIVTNSKHNFKITGHIDGVITDMGGNDFLLEHKAINHFTWQKYENGEIPVDYIAQVALYLCGLQKDNPQMKQAVLLVKNKNTSQYLEFLCEYDTAKDTLIVKTVKSTVGAYAELNQEFPNIVQSCFDKFALLNQCVKKKELPLRQYDLGDWHCDYCPYNEICWADYAKEFEAMKTEAMLPNEIADMVRYYKEVGAHKKEITDEYDEIGEKIKTLMKSLNIREGVAGEYGVKLSLTEVNKIDKAKLTASEIEKATIKSTQERMYIKRIKESTNEIHKDSRRKQAA